MGLLSYLIRSLPFTSSPASSATETLDLPLSTPAFLPRTRGFLALSAVLILSQGLVFLADSENRWDTKSFDEVFPLYFRVPFLVIAQLWCWGFNVYGLTYFGIDYHELLGISDSRPLDEAQDADKGKGHTTESAFSEGTQVANGGATTSTSNGSKVNERGASAEGGGDQMSHHHIFQAASALTLIFCACFSLYTYSPPSTPLSFFPILLYAVLAYFVCAPDPQFYLNQKRMFWRFVHSPLSPLCLLLCSSSLVLLFFLLRSTWRIVTAPFHRVYFADTVLADIYTSFAKVMGDLEALIILFFVHSVGTGEDYHAGVLLSSLGPFVMRSVAFSFFIFHFALLVCFPFVATYWDHCGSLPSAWRLFQCLRQYYDEDRDTRHLKSALVYSTTFPVVIFSAMQWNYRGTPFEETIFLAW